MITTAIEFTHYALIQTGHCVFGVGVTEDEARESAAEWLDGGEDEANRVPEFDGMPALRRSTVDGDLAIVPCTEEFAVHVEAHGTTTWAETDDGICLPSELETDDE